LVIETSLHYDARSEKQQRITACFHLYRSSSSGLFVEMQEGAYVQVSCGSRKSFHFFAFITCSPIPTTVLPTTAHYTRIILQANYSLIKHNIIDDSGNMAATGSVRNRVLCSQ